MTRRLPATSPTLAYWTRERCTVVPTADFWRRHDLMAEIQFRARHGFIPATPFPPGETELKDHTWVGSGWRIYGFLVPPGGSIQVALSHEKPAWFRLIWMDKWGSYRPGMKVRIGEPEARYENPEKETMAVYLLVDDPGFWSTETDPYTLKVARNFDATKIEGTLAAGIWATPPPVTAAH
jgi:hypothetical protein